VGIAYPTWICSSLLSVCLRLVSGLDLAPQTFHSTRPVIFLVFPNSCLYFLQSPLSDPPLHIVVRLLPGLIPFPFWKFDSAPCTRFHNLRAGSCLALLYPPLPELRILAGLSAYSLSLNCFRNRSTPGLLIGRPVLRISGGRYFHTCTGALLFPYFLQQTCPTRRLNPSNMSAPISHEQFSHPFRCLGLPRASTEY